MREGARKIRSNKFKKQTGSCFCNEAIISNKLQLYSAHFLLYFMLDSYQYDVFQFTKMKLANEYIPLKCKTTLIFKGK